MKKMFHLFKYTNKKALLFMIVAIIFIALSCSLDTTQPTFLEKVICSVAFIQKIDFWHKNAPEWILWLQNNPTEAVNDDIWGYAVATFKAAGLWDPTWTKQTIDKLSIIASLNVFEYGYPSLNVETWNEFWKNVGILSGLVTGSLIAAVIGSFYGTSAVLLSSYNMRNGLYKKLTKFSFPDVDYFSPGSLITRMTNDVQKFQINLLLLLTIFLRAPIMFIGGLAQAFKSEWEFGVIMIGIVVIMVLIIALIARKAIPFFMKAQKSLDETNTIMRENVLGVRVVKSFNIEKNEESRFDQKNNNLRIYNIKAQIMMIPIMNVVILSINIGMAAIMLTGGILVNNGDTSGMAPKLFGFINILMMILGASIMAIVVIVNLARTLASVKRIYEIEEFDPTIKNNTEELIDDQNLSITFKNVDFKYENQGANILKKINIKIEPKQTVGIIGGTGCGKSTLVNLIPRLYDIKKGEILLGDKNIKNIPISQLRDLISVVLQQNNLFSGTIRSNMKYGDQNATDEEIIKALQNACAWDFVSKNNKKLDYEVEQRGRNFSGGQKQRLCIARALVKKPKILILDDTTSALDLLTEAQVQKNIRDNYKDITTIIVSQRVSAVKNADQILVLENGEISGLGKHDDLVKSNAIYKEIVESQLGARGLK